MLGEAGGERRGEIVPVTAGPRVPVAAGLHQVCHPLDEADEGDAARLQVLGQRDLDGLGAERPKPLDRLSHRFRRLGLDSDLLGKALGDDAEARAGERVRRLFDCRDIVGSRHVSLSRIALVSAGDRLEQCGEVGGGARQRAAVVEGLVDAGDANVGDEPVGRLQPEDATPRRRRADRAALVAANRDVDAVVEERGRRSARRPAGCPGVIPGVAASVRTSSTLRRPKRRGRPCS